MVLIPQEDCSLLDLVDGGNFHLSRGVLCLYNHLHDHIHRRRELDEQKHCLNVSRKLVPGGLEVGKK